MTTTLEQAQLQQELDTGGFTALGFGFGMQSAVVCTIFWVSTIKRDTSYCFSVLFFPVMDTSLCHAT